jgi:hypothetical protein
VRFDIEIHDRAAIERVDGMRDRAQNFRPVLRQVGEIIEDGVAKNFATRGGYYGDPWPKLAAATIARKARQGLDPGILRATGKLEAAVAGSFERVATKQVRVGTRYFHQATRKLYGVARSDRRKILDRVASYLVGRGHRR